MRFRQRTADSGSYFVGFSPAVCCLLSRNADQLALPRATGAITIDGDLSDPGWNGSLVITKFYEYFKTDNTEPPMQTIAHVTYDDRYLYVDSFSANSLLRLVGQYVDVSGEPGRYLFAVPKHSGSFNGSLLYSYRLNWQTVLFAGYGDDRVLNDRADLLRADRSLFVKISYAIQR